MTPGSIDQNDGVPVTYRIVDIEHVRDGATRAIASVSLEIGGIEFILHFTIRKTADGYDVQMPTTKIRGRRVATVILPAVLSAELGKAVFESFESN